MKYLCGGTKMRTKVKGFENMVDYYEKKRVITGREAHGQCNLGGYGDLLKCSCFSVDNWTEKSNLCQQMRG